jgi:Zn-dependent alcohol dehydrogenase
MQGQSLSHMAGVAGFAEYTVVHQSQVVPIPKDIPIDCAALLSCGVITGFGAVVYRAKVEVASSVVVIGTGGVGLNSIQGAAISGAYPIIAVDISDRKLHAAQAFGATHRLKADDKDIITKVQNLTFGRGADYVFVTVGNTAAVKQGFMMSGPRGMTVVAGLPPKGETIALPPFLAGERMFTSGSMGSTKLSADIPKLVALYRTGRLKLDELITERYPLERINEAIESVEKGEALRNVIIF